MSMMGFHSVDQKRLFCGVGTAGSGHFSREGPGFWAGFSLRMPDFAKYEPLAAGRPGRAGLAPSAAQCEPALLPSSVAARSL